MPPIATIGILVIFLAKFNILISLLVVYFNKLFKQNKSVSKNLNINLNQRPGELSNEMYYKIALQYEKLFD